MFMFNWHNSILSFWRKQQENGKRDIPWFQSNPWLAFTHVIYELSAAYVPRATARHTKRGHSSSPTLMTVCSAFENVALIKLSLRRIVLAERGLVPGDEALLSPPP